VDGDRRQTYGQSGQPGPRSQGAGVVVGREVAYPRGSLLEWITGWVKPVEGRRHAERG
jgi:hypothetical protein